MMAPVGAVRKIWEKTGWKNEEVDLYEFNEAFSVQALGVMRELGLDPNKVNVNGGASPSAIPSAPVAPACWLR